jgi:hypothetical protein
MANGNFTPMAPTTEEPHTVPTPTDAPVTRQAPDRHRTAGGRGDDIVDEWGRQSFPASDPPANW